MVRPDNLFPRSNMTTLLSVAVLIQFSSAGAADEPMKHNLPAQSVGLMRYDDRLDGELKPKAGSDVRWRISVRNDRISGSLAELKDGDEKNHRLSGEIVLGKPCIVSIRQDGPNGLTCFYTGKIMPNGIYGVWIDNRGGSGDFVLVLEKE
jgi:hypothetical protein